MHSDQGYQYTSRQYNELIKKYQMKVSMSRRGNCWNNACMKNFFSHFKPEFFHLTSFRKANEVKLAYVNIYIFIIIKDFKRN
ncbi:TPA: DDE-type integrase/transposase/recombinase [Bacillus thuringiensis]|nr:DDE-type integrase/transposase/recombinase [Bacillus thuringiensis]